VELDRDGAAVVVGAPARAQDEHGGQGAPAGEPHWRAFSSSSRIVAELTAVPVLSSQATKSPRSSDPLRLPIRSRYWTALALSVVPTPISCFTMLSATRPWGAVKKL